jgi:predicted 3-demethylubiquinone-9 3-methyltransferase (glyoxalase superfamily)
MWKNRPMTNAAHLTTSLWFNGHARATAKFYATNFPKSRMVNTGITSG